jgi:DNA-binding response OmpR family regulator
VLRHEAFVGGKPVRLTPIELRILSLLAEEDRSYSRRELLGAAWDTSFVPDDRSCDGHIANIRRKIEDDPSDPRRLLTVRGVGYRLRRS